MTANVSLKDIFAVIFCFLKVNYYAAFLQYNPKLNENIKKQ